MERVNNGTETPGGETSAASGTSAIGSDTITNLNNAFVAAIKVGDWATLSSGFASATERYEIKSKPTATSIQVELNAIVTITNNITVSTKSEMYTDGVAGVGRTIINARTKNINQEEIIAVIEDNGDTLDPDNHKQLSNAVVKRAGDTMTGILTIAANLIINTGKKLFTDLIEDSGAGFINILAKVKSDNGLSSGLLSDYIGWKIFQGTLLAIPTHTITHLLDATKILGITGNVKDAGGTQYNAYSNGGQVDAARDFNIVFTSAEIKISNIGAGYSIGNNFKLIVFYLV